MNGVGNFIAQYQEILDSLPPILYRILGVNEEDVDDDDDFDDVQNMFDLLSLRKILRKAADHKISLGYFPFWMSKEEKKQYIRLLGLYEIVIDHVWEDIDELRRTPPYDVEDDDFDDYQFDD